MWKRMTRRSRLLIPRKIMLIWLGPAPSLEGGAEDKEEDNMPQEQVLARTTQPTQMMPSEHSHSEAEQEGSQLRAHEMFNEKEIRGPRHKKLVTLISVESQQEQVGAKSDSPQLKGIMN